MQVFLVSLLLSFSTALGIQPVPSDTGVWLLKSNWIKSDRGWTLTASTRSINTICKNNKALVLPQIIHGVHKIFADGKLVYQLGDDTFEQTSSFYERGVVNCNNLTHANEVIWSVTTYSQYFARVQSMPAAAEANNLFYFLDVIMNISAAVALLVLALFSVFIFKGRVKIQFIVSLAIGSIFFAVYAALTCGNYLGIKSSMLNVHKLADVSVWIGSLAYFYFFRHFNYLGKVEFLAFSCAFLVGIIIIICGASGDVVQFGTTIPIPFAFLCLLSFLGHSFAAGLRFGFNKNNILGMISLISFALAASNDLFHILGVIESYMLMPIGSVFGVFFLAAAVNQDIEKTYIERDDLVSNLQHKVAEQTQHLSEALEQVKKSQVELVQSARLASLGTLSAGIAHEINNAINYVNGAVIPLERKVMKSIPEGDRAITEKLFAAIKEGTNLTVEIVRSLRNFTGLNQAKVKDVILKDTIESVLTILKSKVSHIEINLQIEENLVLNCYQVGMNQIFMNLISNAIDVLPPANGRISISAKTISNDFLEIIVTDNGVGMSDTIKVRIFDPFFTTKEVGKGTGLGLHIVQKEVERHGGSIKVVSKLNYGTTFTLQISKNLDSNFIKVAA